MALPANNPNTVTHAIAAEIKAAAEKDLASLPDLQADDFALFGTLIQYFSFMDFNLRRALETFFAEKMLPKDYAKFWPDNLQDTRLAEALGAVIKGMNPQKENIEEALVWVQVIESTRLKRNLVAHFAAKRYNGHDVYVFASKSYKDAKKALGADLAQHEAHFVVTPRAEFAEMVEAAKNAHYWLSKKVPEWNALYLKQKPAQSRRS